MQYLITINNGDERRDLLGQIIDIWPAAIKHMDWEKITNPDIVFPIWVRLHTSIDWSFSPHIATYDKWGFSDLRRVEWQESKQELICWMEGVAAE